ncbi:MAG: hypothetical protein NT039_01575 [Candidatus Berkelbacteria bacterium]|nr:hypothetical protein [Candidatus Berkelbacteria bacterium]
MKKIDPRVTALEELAKITPKIALNKKRTRDFSLGMFVILKKIMHSIFGDIWECLEFYGGSREKFEEEAVPFLIEIQIMVYLADIVVENLEDQRRVKACLKTAFKVIDQRIAEEKIKDKKARPLMREVYLFLLKDREVRDKKLILKEKEILRVLHYKVSDLVALMRMAAELSGCKRIPENEWQIWRQFELIREFIDDHEDRDEDIKENAEQFNSIVQLERQEIEVKKVISGECQKLKKMIDKVVNKSKKEKLMKMYRFLAEKRIPQEFGF